MLNHPARSNVSRSMIVFRKGGDAIISPVHTGPDQDAQENPELPHDGAEGSGDEAVEPPTLTLTDDTCLVTSALSQ